MQEMKLIDSVAAETAIKDFFKKQIDEEDLYLEVTDCNADILAVLNALPSVPAVPLEVHERMKRELNEEKQALIAGQETLQKALAEKNAEVERFKKIETTINTFWSELKKIIITKGKETPTLEELLEHMENLKSEAIKEFAERLKKLFDVLECQYFDEDITMNTIRETVDNLVKEMVGEG